MLLRLLTVALIVLSATAARAEQPARYISLAPHLTEILFELGVGEQIVGTVEYSDFPPEATNIPIVGNHHQLNIEAIVAAEPDVVFVWHDGNPELQVQRLKKAGLTVFESAPKTIAELRQEIIQIGTHVKRTERATAVAEAMAEAVKKITDSYQDKAQVSVYYELWYQPLRTLGSDPWMNDLLSRCGAKNIFAHMSQSYPLISLEAVITRDPDLIISPESNQQQTWHDHWSNWPDMTAVKSKAVKYINADWVHRYTSRSIKGLTQLCGIIDDVRQKRTMKE